MFYFYRCGNKAYCLVVVVVVFMLVWAFHHVYIANRLRFVSFLGVCHPRSLLCHTRSKVLSLGQHLKHTFPYSLKIGRVQQQNTCVFSGWTGSGLKSGNVLTNEGVKDAWRQILTDLRRGDNSFSQIGRDFLTISRPSCLHHSLSQECAHTFMFTPTETCKHKKWRTNTGSVFTLKEDAETWGQAQNNNYTYKKIISLLIVFSKTECDEAMEENINRIYCDHVNM